MKYTITCECGLFKHDIEPWYMARIMWQHPNAKVYPAEQYAWLVNDTLAEAEWCVSP